MKTTTFLKLLAGCCLSLVVCSCSRYDSSELYWMEGQWADTSAQYYEEWKYDSGGNMIGKAFQLDDSDTLYHEDLAIAQVGYALMYIAKVSNQNEQRAITFGAREISPTEAIFANNQHDFPNRIHYKFINKNRITVELSSLDGEKKMKQDFQKISKLK